MNVKCASCGEEIVVPEGLADRQHVRCPYCGVKTEYSKPSRIELPQGVENRRRFTSAPAQPEPAADPFVEIKIKPPERTPTADRKPQLRVIRKETDPSAGKTSTEQQMVSRRLHMAEDHVRFYEEMKDLDNRRRNRDKVHGVLMLVVLALCAGGAYWYVGYRKEQRHQAQIAFTAEQNRLEAQRVENERRARELREEEEKLNQQKRLAEEKRRADETKRIQAEKSKEENARFESKVLYRKVCALFVDGEFDFIQAMPTNALPGQSAGEFYYLLPFLDNGEIVVCQSSAKGIESVYRLDGTGRKTAIGADTFLSSLKGKDYLMAQGEKVYFQSKRKKAHVAQISKTEVVDLGKEFFGDVASEVKQLDLAPDELSFEIVFVPQNSKKIVIADTVEYGVQYSLQKVREAIEDAFPMRRQMVTASPKEKKFKRTVVLWDGAHIKRGVDGTTYVPRVAPPISYGRTTTTTYGPGWHYYWESRNDFKRRSRAEYTHAQWQSLYEEAKKQEDAEMQFYERQNIARSTSAETAQSRAERDYAARIDRIYETGTLYFRAKIAKRK